MESQKKVTKTVGTFAIASFLHDIGSDMVFSVWPLYVTSVLGANMAILGLIDGLGDAVVSISQAVSGYVSDKIRKRKIFVWLGYLFGGVARIGYAASVSWPMLIPFRVLDRSGKLRGAPRDAIISDVSTHENRGKHFGILRASDNFGAVIGILIAIALLQVLGYKTLFLLAAIPSFLAVLLVFFTYKEKSVQGEIYKGMRFSDFNRNLTLFFVLFAIFSLGSFSYSFLLVFANQMGFSSGTVPILYLIFTIFAAISSIPFGKLSDRVGRKPLLFISFLFWVVTVVLFLLFQNWLAIVLGFVAYGLHRGAVEVGQKAFVAELAPKEYVASTLGSYQMVVGLCSLPASLIAGLLWDSFGHQAPFYFSLILTCVASVLLLFVKENK